MIHDVLRFDHMLFIVHAATHKAGLTHTHTHTHADDEAVHRDGCVGLSSFTLNSKHTFNLHKFSQILF